ncbi:vitamin K-dependent gamma-carboxylase [Condylostylus longicornis]|uniref:vitamin K-dependent gamma-carboxylase n=1 Tax=Condylostylus longicornis TaxID=2530218 RepID=UPI00244DB31F|nr:vitamin K-dependent gamma-carboxylase [Condylostylus longicornis]
MEKIIHEKNTNDSPTPENIKRNWNKFAYYFKNFTSYEVENFISYKNFVNWLHRPTDSAALGVFRLLFGLAMLIDIPEEREGGHIDVRFGDPKICHFPLIDSIQPLSLPLIGVVYLVMWVGALGITLGYKFKLSCLLFSIPYWYIFLLDKTAWNNHSYLYGLCGVLLFFTDSHKFWSIDNLKSQEVEQSCVPYWNYFLIKFQFFILYFYAGLKKLTAEWLSGYSMTNLGYHWLFLPLRYFLSVELIELLIIHWTTAIFDVTIAFLMTWNKSRIWATPFMLTFHLMNSRLFSIGMFPWVCLAEAHLFFQPDWPRVFIHKVKTFLFKLRQTKYATKRSTQCNVNNTITKTNTNCFQKDAKIFTPICVRKSEVTQSFRVCLIILYCLTQLFLPYSHFITKGYNNWTNGLYGYSWDMMVHSYDTISVSIKIVDNENNESHFLNPYAFSQYDRWTKHSDMAYQYAKCIQRNLINDLKINPNSIIKSANFSIYFDIWCSMNGRFQQRVYDPRQDLTKAVWHPFKKTTWVLPLLHELNYMRPKLSEITKDVLSWSNYSDVLFIADFPGLTLENYIAPELFNITLNVIEGKVDFIHKNKLIVLRSGNNFPVESGRHKVITRGDKASSYMYTFVNRTMLNLKENSGIMNKNDKWLPIWNEILERAENYRDFFYHVGNSFLFLIYGVPMPVRIREHN